MSGRSELIILRGEIVGIAGPLRVQFVDGLDPPDRRFVAFMGLCKHEIDEGRIAGPFTSELAAKWARLVLIGPHNFAGRMSNEVLASQLDVPVDQVALARTEMGPSVQPSADRIGTGPARPVGFSQPAPSSASTRTR